MRSMKSSGVEWIGDIPDYWNMSKLKYLGEYINGYAFKPDDWGDEGKKIIRIQDLTGSNNNPNYYSGVLDGKYNVSKGDILVSWAATLDAFIWNAEDGWLNQHIFKAVPYLEKVNCRFFYWLIKEAMKNMNNDNKHGIFMQHVTLDLFNKFCVPLPPISEQERISDFLEERFSNIDTILEKTRSSLSEYKKLSKAIVIKAVTRGLNPDASFKSSSIEWIDAIPTNWNECRIKNAIFPQQKPVFDDDDIITCFRDGIVTLRKKRREDGFTISFTENGYQGVDEGDLVIHGMDAFAGSIGCSDSRGKTTPVVHVCKTVGNNRYFMYFLRAMAYGDILMDLSNGIRVRSSDFRNFSKLGTFMIAIPPREEQDAIVNYLDKKLEHISKIIEQKEQLIKEIEMYKETMLFDYITGKKEVSST